MLAATAFYNDHLSLFLTGMTLVGLFFWYFITDISRRKRNIGTALTIGIVTLCIMAAMPVHERLKGGIDILGGSSFTLRVQQREVDGVKQAVTPRDVDNAKVIVEKRLNSLGTAEPLIASQGRDAILVQMPGVKPEEFENVRKILSKVSKLELYYVDPRGEQLGPEGKSVAQRVADRDEILPDCKVLFLEEKDDQGVDRPARPILLRKRAALSGSDIAHAAPSQTQPGAVDISLNSAGTDKMIALTKDMVIGRDRIAISLDDKIISAPTVNAVPLGKNFVITGQHTEAEAKTLSDALMNPLQNGLIVEEERSVSPSLGEAVVKQGLMAGGLALLMTFLFVLVYYRVSGFIAIVGLIVNTVMLFGIMAMFGFTFTLPGIAGMVLTIGMAVDANVLIYERLREEIRLGKSLKNAIDSSYSRAFSAIFDSHATSLITAGILFWFGGSAVKGFAVTLLIGVTASLFSAILVTRVIFRWGTDLGWLKRLSFLNLIKSPNYDFMGKRKLCLMLAAVTFVISLGALAYKGKSALGIDFTGGTLATFQLGKEKTVAPSDAQEVLENMKKRGELTSDAYAQRETNFSTGSMLNVRAATKDAAAIVRQLRASIPVLGEKKPGAETYVIDVSQTDISGLVGDTALSESIIAICLGLLGIVIYMTIRFEFSFALGGFVAIFHDITICVGLIVLFGQQLTMIHVGAILTIAGYSISDTIIVFDRVREMLVTHTGSVEKIMNEAVNSTLSRTLLTSGATLISVAILACLGGSSLRDFGLIIFLGIVIGTFSSIFVASPVVLWWSRRKGGNLRNDVIRDGEKGAVITAAQ